MSARYSDAALAYFAEHAIDPDVAHEARVSEDDGAIVWPTVDADGRPSPRRRSLNGGPKTLGSRGASLGVWWPFPASSNAPVLVCEGESDALAALSAIWRSGRHGDVLAGEVMGVGAVPGTGFPADRLAAALRGAGVIEAVLAYDADEAGRQALERAQTALHAVGVRAWPLLLPDGLDLADVLAREALGDRAGRLANLLIDSRTLSQDSGGGASDPEDDDWLGGTPVDPLAEPTEPLATPPGLPFAYEGAAVLIAGPTGSGRSSLLEAVLYDAARAGLRGAYLSGEVTEGECNARAAGLAERRGDPVDGGLRADLAAGFRYFDLATVIEEAWRDPRAWADGVSHRYDVVAIDPVSTVAAALGFDFDTSNANYVAYHEKLIKPLVERGLIVLQADNIGHALEARSRAKGASAKEDKADVILACKLLQEAAALALRVRKVRAVRAPFHRGDEWVFYRDTQRIERAGGGASEEGADTAKTAFRPTVLMGRIVSAIADNPGLSTRGVRGVPGNHKAKELALELLISEGTVEARREGRAIAHYLREQPIDGDRAQVPDRAPTVPKGTVPTVPRAYTRGTGTGTPDDEGTVPLSDDGAHGDDGIAS